MVSRKFSGIANAASAFLARHWPFALVLLPLSALAFSAISSIPFHPDESTYLFMSGDFLDLITEPSALAGELLPPIDPQTRYRLIDAPIVRYILGAGLLLSGQDPLPSDWDWSGTISENRYSGAYPSHSVILAGRLAVTLLFPLSLALVYATGRTLAGIWAGLLSAILLGTNSLVLLHTRRAMAEGPLLFGTLFFLWTITRPRINPILIALALALAVNAKHSALVLAPVAVLAIAVSVRTPGEGQRTKLSVRLGIKNLAKFGVTFAMITWVLNPVAWRDPLNALRLGVELRADLLHRQMEETAVLAPNQVVNGPAARSVSLIANAFILQPSFQEVGNYSEWTGESESIYLSRPWNALFRGMISGGILGILFVFGLVSGILCVLQTSFPLRRSYILLLLATLCVILIIVLGIPLPWQRYVLPLIPFTCLWISIGLVRLGGSLKDSRITVSEPAIS